jgi:hypothetical protein
LALHCQVLFFAKQEQNATAKRPAYGICQTSRQEF